MDTQKNLPNTEPGQAQRQVPPAARPADRQSGWRRLLTVQVGLSVALALAVGVAGFVGIARATDSPTFCGSACHEMGPYHSAWASGAHRGIACIECHVDPSPVARFEHKFVALQEVIDHVKGAPSFPLATAPYVPDSRCRRCHENIVVKQAGFSHALHARKGSCVKCHATVGHDVAAQMLGGSARVEPAAFRSASSEATGTPGLGDGKSIAGHLSVGCAKCHDMASMGCSACHTPPASHAKRPADCTICHSPGAKFVFAHPVRTDCNTCHEPPTTLSPALPANVKPAHTWKAACTQCHINGPGVDWTFAHPAIETCGDCHVTPAKHTSRTTCTDCHKAGPGKSFAFTHPSIADCESCHVRPTGHRSGECGTCHHNPGKSWSFSHPSSSAACLTCHSAPSGHKSNACPTCHATGVSWKFRHPAPSADCASCHNRPSNHHAGSCQTCHRNAGRSWSFSHPASTACASCHTPPSAHYGSACASCHTAGTSWTKTHFVHPKISAPHGVAGKACSKCHPSSPPAYYCTCHGNKTGPSGD